MSAGLPRLLAITPPASASAAGPFPTAPLDVWRDAGARAGEIAILLRIPGDGPRTLWARSGALVDRATRDGYPLWLSLDHARAAEVDTAWPLAGVIVRGDPTEPVLDRVRAALPGLAVGRSAHGLPHAHATPPAFSTFAPVFMPRTETPGRLKRPAGVHALRQFCAGVPEPVFALGGVSAETAQRCLDAGAWGLATIRGFFGPPRTLVHDVDALLQAVRGIHGFSSSA